MYVELTKVSSRGQVVIPQRIRDKFGLAEGMPLAVTEQGDYILLQKMEFPKFDLKAMLSEGHIFAKRKGIQPSDLEKTIRKVRARKSHTAPRRARYDISNSISTATLKAAVSSSSK